MYILLSPYLDKQGLQQGLTSEQILKRAIQRGGKHLIDQAMYPVIKPVEDSTSQIGGAFGYIGDTIHDAMYVPIRSFFMMANMASSA